MKCVFLLPGSVMPEKGEGELVWRWLVLLLRRCKENSSGSYGNRCYWICLRACVSHLLFAAANAMLILTFARIKVLGNHRWWIFIKNLMNWNRTVNIKQNMKYICQQIRPDHPTRGDDAACVSSPLSPTIKLAFHDAVFRLIRSPVVAIDAFIRWRLWCYHLITNRKNVSGTRQSTNIRNTHLPISVKQWH